MRRRLLRLRAGISFAITAALCACFVASAGAPARRPRYGGTLRVEIEGVVKSLDPAAAPANAAEAMAKREIESLVYEKRNADGSLVGVAGSGPFRISEWEPGKHLALAANDDFAGGRPFVDAIEIEMGRSAHDRVADLELDRTDFVEIPAEDARQAAARGVRISASQPDELVALVFLAGHSATEDSRLREAVARSINRAAIVEFLLQKEGEPAGGLLPQWSSGTAFLFPTDANPARMKELRSQIGNSPEIRLGYDSSDTLEQSIAQRIAVDAHESGLAIAAEAVAPGAPAGRIEVELVRLTMASPRPAAALANFLGVLGPLAGIDATAPASSASAEQVYEAEHGALEGFRVLPLVWVPRVYGLSERVKDWQAPATGEAWPFSDIWLDAAAAGGKQN